MLMEHNILFISHEFGIGGASVSLASMLEGMRRETNNINATVVLPLKIDLKKREKMAKDYFNQRGIKTIEMLYRNDYKSMNTSYRIKDLIHDIWNACSVFLLALYIKKNNIEIICSNSVGIDVGARAAKVANVSHCYYIREFMEEDHEISFRNPQKIRRLLERSDYVIFISKAICEKYVTLYNLNKYETFFNGFVIDDYYCERSDVLTQEEIRFIQVGKLSDGKGSFHSLELINRLCEKGFHNVHLDFVGTGKTDYTERMKRYIEIHKLDDVVSLKGYQSNVKEYLKCADILLMNSESEGFGRVTVEGMLSGCLVIGKEAAGTKEIIQNRINGLTFQSDDEWEMLIWDVFSDRGKYQEIAQNGQKWARATFDCTITAKKFIEFLGL